MNLSPESQWFKRGANFAEARDMLSDLAGACVLDSRHFFAITPRGAMIQGSSSNNSAPRALRSDRASVINVLWREGKFVPPAWTERGHGVPPFRRHM